MLALLFNPSPCWKYFWIRYYGSTQSSGKSLGELIMSVARRPFAPHLDMKGFYVMISRARRRDRIRVLKRPSRRDGGLDHLLSLRHAPELGVWNEGYDAMGDWDTDLARASAVRHGQRGPAPKRKAFAMRNKPMRVTAALKKFRPT